MAATQICCVPCGETTPYSRWELNAIQWKPPGGAQVGCEFSVWPVPSLFDTMRLALSSSIGFPPIDGTIHSWADRSPCPPLPREYAIHLPSGLNCGNRFD